MKKFLLLLPLFLFACAQEKPVATIDAYFAAKYGYTVVLAGATAYKDVCKSRPKEDHCHVVVITLRELDNAVAASQKDMDAAIKSGDTSNQKIAFAAFNAAVTAAKTYKEREVK